ncbi:hypothetical protein [Lewinella sp. W8]|uniref:hypothetical protein n=1 Tax=Lewinella sp. W8 TaxID=2528208 RepID=UPI001067CB02|nr:hypothetical protein [Lewinella sp. W8]MTB50285.1 hypothetical protein [Lewinella sp. W8]
MCYTVKGFNLYAYDTTPNIFEAKVLAEGKEVYQLVDTTGTKNLVEENVVYLCQVERVFKGKSIRDTIVLYWKIDFQVWWIPRVGKEYILYLDFAREITNGGKSIYEFGSCHPDLLAGTDEYAEYVMALNHLSRKESTRFTSRTSFVEYYDDPSAPNIRTLTGGFRNGRRHGTWIFYKPYINFLSDSIPEPKEALTLTYERGRLLDVKAQIDDDLTAPFVSGWYNHYRSKLNKE